MSDSIAIGTKVVVTSDAFQTLLDALVAGGYDVFGPTLADDAIMLGEIRHTEDLPVGKTEYQDGGRYRLVDRDDEAIFGFANGPHSWKQFLHPPSETIWSVRKDDNGLQFAPPEPDTRKRAFVGVRACDLAAIAIHDRVFDVGTFADSNYRQRRARVLIVAVNCSEPGGTCFCVSTETGPSARTGFDLALTELIDATRHEFLIEIGSTEGAGLISTLSVRLADQTDIELADALLSTARTKMGRSLDIDGLKDILQDTPEHPRWKDVADRCLSCANCTMVCPTCFCTNVSEHPSLDGETVEQRRNWDSCFSLEFSFIHGGNVRSSVQSRYRQWMTHKLAYWYDQFGSSGCVGCGRCITWCPVGIDITEEAAAIRATPQVD
jgi:ferredoxin